jgi:hypothetical protein
MPVMQQLQARGRAVLQWLWRCHDVQRQVRYPSVPICFGGFLLLLLYACCLCCLSCAMHVTQSHSDVDYLLSCIMHLLQGNTTLGGCAVSAA